MAVNKLGRTIKSLRLKHNMSQPKLATKVGVHYQTLGHWERGNIIPSEKYLIQLKGIFRLSDNEYDVLTIGIKRKRPVTSESRKKARRERLEVLQAIGNTRISELEDDDPRLIELRKVVGAK